MDNISTLTRVHKVPLLLRPISLLSKSHLRHTSRRSQNLLKTDRVKSFQLHRHRLLALRVGDS